MIAAFGLTAVQNYLERAQAHDKNTLAMEIRWQGKESTGVFGPETVALDQVVDDAVVGVHDIARAQMRGRDPGYPTVQAAERVLGRVFPLGVGAVVNAPYVKEAALVEHIMAQLQGSLAADVALLHLDDMVAHLASLAARYRQAVNAGNQRLSFVQVREGRLRGMEFVAEILVMVMAAFHDRDNPDHLRARQGFLDVFIAHQEQIRAARRARQGLVVTNSSEMKRIWARTRATRVSSMTLRRWSKRAHSVQRLL